MSNKKKKKVQKTGNPQVAQDIFLGLKTIISNDACIKCAREWKGIRNIIPIILALGSVVLALVPYYVNQTKVQGASAVLTSPTSNYEVGLASMIHSLAFDGNDAKRAEPITLEVNSEGKLHFVNNSADFFNSGSGNSGWYTLTRLEETSEGNMKPHIVFEAFFNTDPTNISDSDFFTRIDSNQNPFTAERRDLQVGSDATLYQSSYIAFGNESVRYRRRNETVTVGGLNGSYELLKNRNLTNLAAVDLVDLDLNTPEYITKVAAYFTDFVNQSYEPAKQRGLWTYTGIFFGVDVGALILFGLMLFLMTRGKKNPFRIYTFWECQKMSYWAALTPAVLSLIGFAIPNMAFILFFFIFGFRMMWMSMKSMRPMA